MKIFGRLPNALTDIFTTNGRDESVTTVNDNRCQPLFFRFLTALFPIHHELSGFPWIRGRPFPLMGIRSFAIRNI
jgi:hypothetical protein